MVSQLGNDVYKTLFIKDESTSTATVIGDEPVINIVSEFSVIWFLFSYFLPQLEKDQPSNRMSSYDDLVDIICDRDPNMAKIVQEANINIRSQLQLVCDVVNEADEEFYRVNKEKMIQFVNERIADLAEHLPKRVMELLIVEIGTETPEILALAKREQASELLMGFVDDKWISWANLASDFTPLREQMKSLAKMDLIDTQKRPQNESPAGKTKPVKKQKKESVKVGALDRFFTRKV